MKRIARIGRYLVIDARPLRKSRDLRCLFGGQLVVMLGGQLTTVAVPYQVYSLTRSSLDVGLVSLAQLLPLIAGGLAGGALADAVDRRSLLLASQLLTAPSARKDVMVKCRGGSQSSRLRSQTANSDRRFSTGP